MEASSLSGPLPKKLDLKERGKHVSFQKYRWDMLNFKILRNSEVGVDKGK